MPTIVLLGQPVAHSVSPAMHNAAFDALALDYTYVAEEVSPPHLGAAVARLRSGAWAGANVTIPHKQAVVDHLDALTETALAFGAVNTIFRAGQQLIGDNTDVPGFLADLDAFGVDVVGQPTLIFGTGGSARAVAFGLLQRGAEVRLLGRNLSAGAQLAGDLHQATGGRILNFPWTPTDLALAAEGCVLAVNCTPLGMTPNVQATPWFQVVAFPPNIFVYDLVYNPPETQLVRQARSQRHEHAPPLRAASGLGMLVRQGALAFERWTGVAPPLEVMRAAAERELHA